jgi:ubiquinone/menaquinone biosynthesis C-methylase UbiE
MSSHEATIRREFAKQVASFADPHSGFADPRLMSWILRHVPCDPGSLVLDVAGGTGQVARAYADKAACALVADITPEMLAAGRRECDAQGRGNVLFVLADAASLPFLRESFDLVVSRFAVHHFQRPELQITEMARVCRHDGRVGIVDLVAAHPTLAASQDRLERMRDPSHTQALSEAQLSRLMETAGLQIVERTEHDQPVPIERWLSQAQTPTDIADAIRHELRVELEGGEQTGMRPQIKGGDLCQTQRWAILVGRKAHGR